MHLRAANGGTEAAAVRVDHHPSSDEGAVSLGRCSVSPTGSWSAYEEVACPMSYQHGPVEEFNLVLRFDGPELRVDSFRIEAVMIAV